MIDLYVEEQGIIYWGLPHKCQKYPPNDMETSQMTEFVILPPIFDKKA
jgi:hypothetical protein